MAGHSRAKGAGNCVTWSGPLSRFPYVIGWLLLVWVTWLPYSEARTCQAALDDILSAALSNALAIANDASSRINFDAFEELSVTTGYPGQIGDYGECQKVQLFNPRPKQASVSTHLCLAGSVALNSSMGLPPFGGVCVPVECDPPDLQGRQLMGWLSHRLDRMAQDPTVTETQLLYVKTILDHAKLAAGVGQGWTCGTYHVPKLGRDGAAVLGFAGLLCAFVVWATVVDLVKAPDYPEDTVERPALTAKASYSSFANNGHQGSGVQVGNGAFDHVSKYIAAFSVPRNLCRIFASGERSELSVFDGLRVISMLWVVLGHTLAVQASVGYTNPEAVFPPHGVVGSMVGQLFFSARFSVDTFFFISGFLVVYVMLRKLGPEAPNPSARAVTPPRQKHRTNGKARGWPEWLPFFYVHRLLRITPPYMFCLLVWWKVAVFLGEGPFWYRWQFYIGRCDCFWWSNLLYVNNLVPWHAGEIMECFYHTWYLANDMQFYMLSPLLIMLYLRSKFWGALATLGMLVASVAAMAVGTFGRDWSALTLDGSWVVRYSQETYTTPWFRLVPYVMGMLSAMGWHEKQRRWPNFKLTNPQRYLALTFAIGALLLTTFSGLSGYQRYPCAVDVNPSTQPCGSGWSRWQRALYNAGTRPAWSLGVAVLCFVCFNNQGGLIQQMLEHRGWVPISRLSFGAYLLHPIVINLWFLNTTVKFHFSKLDFVMIYICVATVTFGSSLLLALLVESPLTKLGRYAEAAMQPRKRSESAEFDAAAQSPGFIERPHHSGASPTQGSINEAAGLCAGAQSQTQYGYLSIGRIPSESFG